MRSVVESVERRGEKCEILPQITLDFFGVIPYYIHSTNQEDFAMSNYTPEMVARITAAAPLNLAKAKELAADFGNVLTAR